MKIQGGWRLNDRHPDLETPELINVYKTWLKRLRGKNISLWNHWKGRGTLGARIGRQVESVSDTWAHFTLFNFILVSYWGIVDLQCITFKCTAKLFSYTYKWITYPFCSRFFSHIDHHRILTWVPCAMLFICLMYSSVWVHPNLLIYPSPQHFHFGNISLFSISISLFLFCE